MNYRKLLFFFALIIFTIVIVSKNDTVDSDSLGTLLTSQSIIEHKTIKLDNYNLTSKRYFYQICKKNENYYYYFPLGSSVSSIPFVFIATKIFSLNMNDKDDDAKVQKIIAGIISALIFLFLFKIAAFYFSSNISVYLAFVFWLSTSLSSTLGTGLWSQNFATLYSAIAIYLTLYIIKDKNKETWFILGLVLFLAYLTRPTMSLLSIFIVLFLFFNHKRAIAMKTALVVSALLGVFVLFSIYEYKQLLPDYYMPKRLDSNTFYLALYGNLFSPSRGLFIYSPFLLLFLFNIDKFYIILKKNKTLLFFLTWIILHLIVISKFPHWWAGASFGPRFMVDVLIPIYILFLILLYEITKDKNSLRYKLNLIFLISSVILSVYINTYQGLFNKYTKIWSSNPNIDEYPEYLFDWRYPQFLHDKHRQEERLKEFHNRKEPTIFNSRKIIYEKGWSHLEKNYIWSIGNNSLLSIKLEEKNYNGTFILDTISLGEQKIKIYINNNYISTEVLSIYKSEVKFDPNILKLNALNTIKFGYSNPHKPNNGDKRELAMALKSFTIE